MKAKIILLILVAFLWQNLRAQNKVIESLLNRPIKVTIVNGETFLQRDLTDYLNFTLGVSNQANNDIESDAVSNISTLKDYFMRPQPNISTIRKYFEQASKEFNVPSSLLMIIGQIENNWTQTGPTIDQGWGIMHLVQNNYCNTLGEASKLIGVPEQVLKDNAFQNIRGAAALIAKYASKENEKINNIETWFPAVAQFSGLISPELRTLQAKNYFEALNNGIIANTVWGEEIVIEAMKVSEKKLDSFQLNIVNQPSPSIIASPDYGPAIFNSAAICNYASGRTHSIDTWVNHWIASGTYLGTISWFQTCPCSTSTPCASCPSNTRGCTNGNHIGASSAHFVIKNSNGEITQMVGISNTAYHCGASGFPNNNPRSIGVEHEATSANPGMWNSIPMLNASATMACYFKQLYGFPTTQNTSPGICGHNDMPGTSTTCPGPLPWSTWFSYFNGACNATCPQPSNDGCNGSFSATPLTFGTTCNPVSSTSCGATNSGFSSCVGNSDDDVFFRFTPTSTSATITVTSSAGYDAVFQALSGTCGASMTQLACVNNTGTGGTETTTLTGLTIGTQYFIRVWHFGTGYGTTGNFSICVYGSPALPDLTITTNTQTVTPGTVTAGANVTAGCSEDNSGNGFAGANHVTLWLSTDNILNTTNDVYLGQIAFPSLPPSSNSLFLTNSVQIPANTCSGNYFLFFWADGNQVVTETIENNNFATRIITVNGITLSPPTANAASNINPTTFQANWNSVGGATSYRLDVSTNSGFSTYVPGFQDLNVGNVISYNVTGLNCNTQYFYRLRASTTCGTSGNSNTATVITSVCCTAPSAPQNDFASNLTTTSFQANWFFVGGATGYLLDVSTDPNFNTYLPGFQSLNVGNANSFNVTGLSCQTIYHYRVRAFNNCGPSGYSTAFSVSTVPCCPPPGVPQNSFASNITTTSFQANWFFVSGATAYLLDVSTDPNFNTYVPGYGGLNVGNVNSYNVSSLNCLTTYYYRLRAINNCQASGYSTNSALSTLFCCNAPNNPTVNQASNITSATFTANWNFVSGAITYSIDVSTNSSFSSFVPGYQNLNVSNNTSVSVNGLFCNTNYYYRVRANNNCGASINSGIISVLTAPCCTVPTNPTVNQASNVTSTTFNANWNFVSGAIAYYLDVSTNSAFTNFVNGYNNRNVGTNTILNVNGLNCNSFYYYRVRAFNSCGASLNSGIISVLTAACCTPPNSPVNKPPSNITSTSFMANWLPVNGSNSYLLDVARDAAFTNYVNGYSNLNVGNNTFSNVTGLACNTFYYYRVRAFNNCGASLNSGTFNVQTPTCFVRNIDGLEEFTVLPNPNNGNFSIRMRLSYIKDVAFKIYNNLGQMVYTSEDYKFSGPFVKDISIANISHGVYSLRTTIDTESFTVNIIFN